MTHPASQTPPAVDPIDLLPGPALVPRSQAAPYLPASIEALKKWAARRQGPPAYQLGVGRGQEAHYVAADLRLFKQLRAEGKSLATATAQVNQAAVRRQLDFGVKFIWGQAADAAGRAP